jgi:hypothetical protein
MRPHKIYNFIILPFLFLFSTLLILKTSDEPLVNSLTGTMLEPWLLQYHHMNSIVHNLSLGILVSLIFYFLVIFIPTHFRRKSLRNYLLNSYSMFKKNCIEIFLEIIKHSQDLDLSSQLIQQKSFKEYFEKMNIIEYPDGKHDFWMKVRQDIENYHYEKIIVQFEYMSDQIRFVFTQLEVDDIEAFGHLCWFQTFTISLRDNLKIDTGEIDYEEEKYFFKIMTEIFMGWDLDKGQKKESRLERVIKII